MILRLINNESGIIATYLIADKNNQGKLFNLVASIQEMVPDFKFKNYKVKDSSVKERVFENAKRKECTIIFQKVRRSD